MGIKSNKIVRKRELISKYCEVNEMGINLEIGQDNYIFVCHQTAFKERNVRSILLISTVREQE